MKPKMLAIFLLIVITPSILLLYLGFETTNSDQEHLNSKFYKLVSDRLRDINSGIEKFIKSREREFSKVLSLKSFKKKKLRKISSRRRLINQVFVIDNKDVMLFPLKGKAASSSEKNFFKKTHSIWETGMYFANNTPESGAAASHWYTWFWGEGLQILYWQRTAAGYVAGLEISRIAFMADLIASLPDTKKVNPTLTDSRIVLTDANDFIIYQWGHYKNKSEDVPFSRQALPAPLSSWSLKYYLSPEIINSSFLGTTFLSVAFAIILVIIIIIFLSYYFYTENNKQLQDALNKVSFVNRVSHELKTPLTNIRMYAEFLQEQIPAYEKKSYKYVKIVIAECERLSRLIGNVLTFAKKQNQGIKLQLGKGRVSQTVNSVIESFKPSLRAKGIKVYKSVKTPRLCYFDADIVKQILSNLVSNVEKYGVSGKYIKITCSQEGDLILLSVADKGPGIEKTSYNDIFKPFYRLSNKTSDGVSGTGIGLTIVRDLAHTHKGSVQVSKQDDLTIFSVTLQTSQDPKKLLEQ